MNLCSEVFMYEMYICTSWALYINLDIWDYKFFEMFLKDMRTKTWQVLEIKQNKIMYTLLKYSLFRIKRFMLDDDGDKTTHEICHLFNNYTHHR